jgi:chemotaxis protein methyltransferase CheR
MLPHHHLPLLPRQRRVGGLAETGASRDRGARRPGKKVSPNLVCRLRIGQGALHAEDHLGREAAPSFPGVSVSIVATDVDENVLARARRGCFEPTSLRELPPDLVGQAFDRARSLYCIKSGHRKGVEFLRQDVRQEKPALPFDLILCRYVAFTYFSEPLQRQVLMKIIGRLASHGYLVIGTHERLPIVEACLAPLSDAPLIFERKVD